MTSGRSVATSDNQSSRVYKVDLAIRLWIDYFENSSRFLEQGNCNRILLSENEMMHVGRCRQLCGQCAPTRMEYTNVSVQQ